MADFLIIALGIVTAVILLTGGGLFHLSIGTLDLTQINVWVISFGVLLWLRKGGLWASFQSGIQRGLDLGAGWFWGLLLGLFGLLTLAHFFRHAGLKTDAYDLVFLHQALFYQLKCDLCIGGTYLGEHLAFSLRLLTPLFGLWKSDEAIFLFESLLVFFPIWGLFKWGPLRHHPRSWTMVLLIAFCAQAFRNAIVWDFREDHLAFAAMIGSLVGLYRGSFLLYGGLSVLALLSKENISLILPFVAFPILFERSLPFTTRQRRWLAFSTVAVSAAWTYVSFRYLIPFYNAGAEGQNNIVLRFAQYGHTPLEVLVNILTVPSNLIGLIENKFFHVPALKYLVYLLLPYCFFLVRAPIWIVPAIPGIMMNLLADTPTQLMQIFHYELVILPYLLMGLSVGFLRIFKRDTKSGGPAQFWSIALLTALAFSGRWPMAAVRLNYPLADERASTNFLRKLELAEPVACTSKTMAQLSRISELREMHFSPDSKSWIGNYQDRSGIKNHTADGASTLVLDLKSPPEQALVSILSGRGWKEISHDSSNRFSVWTASGRSP